VRLRRHGAAPVVSDLSGPVVVAWHVVSAVDHVRDLVLSQNIDGRGGLNVSHVDGASRRRVLPHCVQRIVTS